MRFWNFPIIILPCIPDLPMITAELLQGEPECRDCGWNLNLLKKFIRHGKGPSEDGYTGGGDPETGRVGYRYGIIDGAEGTKDLVGETRMIKHAISRYRRVLKELRKIEKTLQEDWSGLFMVFFDANSGYHFQGVCITISLWRRTIPTANGREQRWLWRTSHLQTDWKNFAMIITKPLWRHRWFRNLPCSGWILSRTVPLDELEKYYIVPVSIASELKDLPGQMTRIVERD